MKRGEPNNDGRTTSRGALAVSLTALAATSEAGMILEEHMVDHFPVVFFRVWNSQTKQR